MKRARLAAGAVIAATGLLVTAAPASGAPPRLLLNAHIGVSSVAGPVPVGAGVTVIHYCPAGSHLDKADTRAVGEFHGDHLRVSSTEYWPAGLVVRYRVTKRLSTARPAFVATAAVCASPVTAGAARFGALARVDLRVWGPAAARVELVNATVVAATDDPDANYLLRTSMRAAGVNSDTASVRGAVKAVQERFSEAGVDGVVAMGMMDRSVRRGQFVSMRNNYRFVANLEDKIDGELPQPMVP